MAQIVNNHYAKPTFMLLEPQLALKKQDLTQETYAWKLAIV